MQKVLVVDDEKLARTDVLYKAARSGFQFEWIMEAESGEDALEMIRDDPPDILLTDIKMEQMDGIELIRHAKELYPDLVPVIICGYPDFRYAQQAISLGVVDYLLKPVRQEQVTAVLNKASLAVLRQKNQIAMTVHNDMLRQKLDRSEMWEQLHAFFNGTSTPDPLETAVLFPPEFRYFQVCLIRLSAQDDSEMLRREDYRLMRFGARNIMEEVGGEALFSFDTYADSRQLIAITASSRGTQEEAEQELLELAGKLHRLIGRSVGARLHMGLSAVTDKLYSMHMQQARQAMDLRLCFVEQPLGQIFYYEDYVGRHVEILEDSDLQLFQTFLQKGDLQNVLDTVQHVFNFPVGTVVMNLRAICTELLCLLVRICLRKGVEIVPIVGTESINGKYLDQFETREQLVDKTCDLVRTAVLKWITGEMEDTGSIIQKVDAYIREHFTDSTLCTRSLSNQFCISLGYLSASYKKAYGITISKQILSLRMQYAEKLIMQTHMPLHVIAENCGFNNLSYFMRVFKSYFNTTPSQYREQKSQT